MVLISLLDSVTLGSCFASIVRSAACSTLELAFDDYRTVHRSADKRVGPRDACFSGDEDVRLLMRRQSFEQLGHEYLVDVVRLR